VRREQVGLVRSWGGVTRRLLDQRFYNKSMYCNCNGFLWGFLGGALISSSRTFGYWPVQGPCTSGKAAPVPWIPSSLKDFYLAQPLPCCPLITRGKSVACLAFTLNLDKLPEH
jgi:hypothetical protein